MVKEMNPAPTMTTWSGLDGGNDGTCLVERPE